MNETELPKPEHFERKDDAERTEGALTAKMHRMAKRISRGAGRPGELEQLEAWASTRRAPKIKAVIAKVRGTTPAERFDAARTPLEKLEVITAPVPAADAKEAPKAKPADAGPVPFDVFPQPEAPKVDPKEAARTAKAALLAEKAEKAKAVTGKLLQVCAIAIPKWCGEEGIPCIPGWTFAIFQDNIARAVARMMPDDMPEVDEALDVPITVGLVGGQLVLGGVAGFRKLKKLSKADKGPKLVSVPMPPPSQPESAPATPESAPAPAPAKADGGFSPIAKAEGGPQPLKPYTPPTMESLD